MSATLFDMRPGMRVFGRALVVFALLLSAPFIAGCGNDARQEARVQRALIETPAAGDYYAAELTYFSDAAFEQQQDVFGLMKVVMVNGDDITLVTENGGSPDPESARRDLAGDPAAAQYDESERIVIARADLAAAFDAGHVLGVRR